MFELIPQRNNATARRLILLLFFGAAAIMLLTLMMPTLPFRWVFQLFSLGLLTAAIFLVTRYVTKLFIYRVESDGDLTVTEANAGGKRRITVCRVGLSGLCRLERLGGGEAASNTLAELRKQQIRLFDYTPDLNPADSILAVFCEGGEKLAIRLAYDDALFELLRAALTEEDSDEADA